MSLTDHSQDWIQAAAWSAMGASILACLSLLVTSYRLTGIGQASVSPEPAAMSWPDLPANRTVDWRSFQTQTGSAPIEKGSLSARFRLAGTFFSYGETETISDQRRAIVDDLQAGIQRILSEGEEMDGVRVVRVFRDRIILREGATEEQLWLSFSTDERAGDGETGGASQTNSVDAARWANGGANRFGIKRVGENRWLFNRENLLDYYAELRDEPERLLHVFDSLKPLYTEDGKINGYQVGIEGEADFFHSVGFAENDIVRSVNSIEMTNRRRAEFFIHEFVNDRANAFVLEVERNGEVRKLIYQMR